MGNYIEKVYYLENPELGIKKLATESQVKYENIIKDVFGVAFLDDLSMMIQYNKKFQECVCKANNINGTQVSLEMVFRIASKHDLLPLKNHYLQLKKSNELASESQPVSPPFNSTILLVEGVFNWNDKEFTYDKAN